MDPAPSAHDVGYDVFVGLDVGRADHHACAPAIAVTRDTGIDVA